MRVIQVIDAFHPSLHWGGMQEAVLRLCQGLLETPGCQVEVATTGHATDARRETVEGVPVDFFPRRPRHAYAVSPSLLRHLLRRVGEVDLVHVTGLFSFPGLVASRIARMRRVPFVVSPSGACSPWAMAHRRWKKAPYFQLVQRDSLARATALHAASFLEAMDLERLFPSTQTFVVPNAVAEPRHLRVKRHPNRILYLGRSHPIKGLPILLEAVSRLRRERPNVELHLAGPSNDDWSRLTRGAQGVVYRGEVDGAKKSRLLASAAVLALTSHSESFGLVVAEALTHGTPVVASQGSPWQCIETAGAGRWVANRPGEVAAALEDVLTRPDGGLAMRGAARKLATRFSSTAVGAAMRRHYDALRHIG